MRLRATTGKSSPASRATGRAHGPGRIDYEAALNLGAVSEPQPVDPAAVRAHAGDFTPDVFHTLVARLGHEGRKQRIAVKPALPAESEGAGR